MALTVGTNSYVSLAEANAYFTDRIDTAAWTAADDTMKSQALVTATCILEDEPWTGYVSSRTQNLAWPRTGYFYDPSDGLFRNLSELGDVPDRVKKATYELAYHLVNNDGLLDSTSGVDSIRVGEIELRGLSGSASSPSVITRTVAVQINPLLEGGGGRTWFRAN